MQSENSKIHQNLFSGGLNKDLNQSFVESAEYFDAHNVTLVEANKFLALQNISGTTNVQNIINDTTTLVLKVVSADFKISDQKKRCLVIFTAKPDDYFKILAYDIAGDTLYELYREVVADNYFTNDRLVDVELYPENNVDLLYFTDFYEGHGIRKLRCEIPSPYTPWFITESELSLARSGAIGKIELGSVANGGSLFCGAYLFAYQLFVPGTNKSTRYSLLSQPIQIFDDSGVYPMSAVGVTTTKKIFLNIFPSEAELAAYTHFRLAVIENIYPENDTRTTALLTDTMLISDYLSGGYIKDVEYATNLGSSSTSVPIEEIVVDLAAIDTVKTLAIRDNRLLAGNIKYKDLSYDNGTPIIGGGSILKVPFDFWTAGNYEKTTRNIGYYRDEVYRFAISYFDENGNFSPPSPLNMGSVTGNQFGGSLTSGTPISITNSDFGSGLTGWSQVDPGTGGGTWVTETIPPNIFGPGGQIIKVASMNNASPYTDIVYQPVTIDPGTYGFQSRITLFLTSLFDSVSSTDVQIVYLDNSNTILGTQTLLVSPAPVLSDISTIAINEQEITVPSGTTRIGFRGKAITASDGGYTLVMDFVKISNIFRDMKFPSRETIVGSERYSLLNANNLPENLGLSLTGIDNHPTWAKGFVVLRAKRKPNILWESPFIPLMEHYGIGAVREYPTRALETQSLTEKLYPNAQPQGPNITLFPNNYFFEKQREYVKNTLNTGSTIHTIIDGEARPRYESEFAFGLVFPDPTMYSTNSQYVYNSAHQLKSVDAALVYSRNRSFNTSTDISNGNGLGNFIGTSVTATLYTHLNGAYYYDANHNKASFRAPLNIKDYRAFDNLSQGFSMNGFDIMRKENLETDGISWGVDGFNIQRGAVVQLHDGSGNIPVIVNSNADGSVNTLSFADGNALLFRSENRFMPYINTSFSSTARVNTVEIMDCVAGLSDDRYGTPNSFNEYILTGAHVVFTNNELLTVQSGGTLPKSVNVWGGDCVVTRHTYKISDTVYNTMNGNKFLVSNGGEQSTVLARNWQRTFLIEPIAGDNNDPNVSLLLPMTNGSQYIDIYLQSKYNGFLNNTNGVLSNTDVNQPKLQTQESGSRTPLTYDLNHNHAKENDYKIFVPVDTLFPNVVATKARIIYSDQKVYQGGIEGFDVFRALSFHDLGENYGGITKLSLVGDDVYALQERAINYVGVGERVLEQTDASQLAVRTGDVIGTVILVDTNKGCQHMGSVQNAGDTLYFVDNFNKATYALAGRTLVNISDRGLQSECRNIYSTLIPENQITSVYDPIRREYWMARNNASFCYVFNSGLQKWVSNYEFPNGVLGGIYTYQDIYLLGRDTTGLSIHKMYSTTDSRLFGTYVVPRVQFIINPEYQFGKQFDNLLVVASDRLNNVDLLVEREVALGNQSCNAVPLDVPSRGLGNFKVKILRDEHDARLKGSTMKALIRWKSGASVQPVLLTSVLTQYRPILKQF